MKKVIFTILILFTFSILLSQDAEYIVIKHIGEQSKPVYPITIIRVNSDTSKLKEFVKFEDKLKPQFNYKNTLDSSMFALVLEKMFKYKSNNSVLNKDYKFGSFKITYYKNQKKKDEIIFLKGKESIPYFESLSNYINLLNNKKPSKLEYFLCSLLCRLKSKSPKTCGKFTWKME